MYDMYPWNKRSAPDAGKLRPATNAVQVALDRRDNGGEAAVATAAAGAAGTSAEPTAGPTRQ